MGHWVVKPTPLPSITTRLWIWRIWICGGPETTSKACVLCKEGGGAPSTQGRPGMEASPGNFLSALPPTSFGLLLDASSDGKLTHSGAIPFLRCQKAFSGRSTALDTKPSSFPRPPGSSVMDP